MSQRVNEHLISTGLHLQNTRILSTASGYMNYIIKEVTAIGPLSPRYQYEAWSL
jgi:hypothetical protein